MNRCGRWRVLAAGGLLLAATLVAIPGAAFADLAGPSWAGEAARAMGPINVAVSGAGQGLVSGSSLHVDFECTTVAAGFIVGNTSVGCWLLGADGVRYSAPSVSEPMAPSVTTRASLDVPLQGYELCMSGGNSGNAAIGINGVWASGCFPEL
jgi:hypothetical protein